MIASLQSDSISPARKAPALRRARVLEALLAEGKPLAVEWIYASSDAKLDDVKWLAEAGWVDLVYEEEMRDPLSGRSFAAAEPPILTDEQDAALQMIVIGDRRAQRAERFLLFGITGSGKTEVYLRAAEETVRRGRQAIVLVPEIALTPQMVLRFGSRFTGRLGLVHSMLSQGERYDVWRRARAGNLDVVLGPRSALFSPAAGYRLDRPGRGARRFVQSRLRALLPRARNGLGICARASGGLPARIGHPGPGDVSSCGKRKDPPGAPDPQGVRCRCPPAARRTCRRSRSSTCARNCAPETGRCSAAR